MTSRGFGVKKKNYFPARCITAGEDEINNSVGPCRVIPERPKTKIIKGKKKKKTSAKANTRVVKSVSHTVHFTDDTMALSTGMSTTTRWHCAFAIILRKNKKKWDGPGQPNNREKEREVIPAITVKVSRPNAHCA